MKSQKMERLTGHLKDIDESDTARCAIPEEKDAPVCTFKEKGEAKLTMSISKEDGDYMVEAFKGNNADLVDRWDEDEVKTRKELEKDTQHDGNCFTDENMASEKGECIVGTSGVYHATSRDQVFITMDENLGE